MLVTLTIGELLGALSALLGGFGVVVTWLLTFTLGRITKLQEKIDGALGAQQQQTHDWVQTVHKDCDAKIEALRLSMEKQMAELRVTLTRRTR